MPFDSNDTIKHLLSLQERLGITRIADLTRLDRLGIHVISCIRPRAKHLSLSQGKGLNREQAIISAMMEAVEIYHFENPPRSDFSGSYQSLQSNHHLLSPSCAERSDFDGADLETVHFDWIKATNLLNQETVYLPQVLSKLDSSIPQPHDAFFRVSTNGLAAGMTMDHAICHSLCEIIERDSLSIWQKIDHQEKSKTLLDQSSINIPALDPFFQQAAHEHIEIQLWEITSPLGLPAFHCTVLDASLGGLGISSGTGAHYDKTEALLRAVTEAAQDRLTLITGNRDDLLPLYYQQQKTLPNDFAAHKGKKDFKDCRSLLPANTPKEEVINTLLERISHTCDQVLMVDHSKSDIGIPAVHILIPGMQMSVWETES
jgi:YcaO-like protein with predicted kinase domain